MDRLTEIISTEIKKQYKSIRKFSDVTGIAQTTIVSALKKGIGGTAYDTVVKICTHLNIGLVNYDSHIVMTNDVIDLTNMYTCLDEKGMHAVMAFAAMEYDRCNNNNSYITSAASFAKMAVERKASSAQSGEPEIVAPASEEIDFSEIKDMY